MKTTLPFISKIFFYTFCFALLISLSSCFRSFYKTNTRTSIDASTASALALEKKYFIIHFLNATKALAEVHTQDDSIFGKINTLPPEHSKYLTPQVNDKEVHVKKADIPYALSEVHLYTNAEWQDNDSLFSANLSSFYRVDIYEFNKGTTSTNHIMSVVGLIIAAWMVFLLVICAGGGCSIGQ